MLDWRCQQEADLLGIAPADLPAEERARLADFIQYFERITRRMLAGGITADVVVKLDRNRVPGPIAGGVSSVALNPAARSTDAP